MLIIRISIAAILQVTQSVGHVSKDDELPTNQGPVAVTYRVKNRTFFVFFLNHEFTVIKECK